MVTALLVLLVCVVVGTESAANEGAGNAEAKPEVAKENVDKKEKVEAEVAKETVEEKVADPTVCNEKVNEKVPENKKTKKGKEPKEKKVKEKKWKRHMKAYVHVDEPVCDGVQCNYWNNTRKVIGEPEKKKEISDALKMLSRQGFGGFDGHISVKTDAPVGGNATATYVLIDRFGVPWGSVRPHHVITVELGTRLILESNNTAKEWRSVILLHEAIHTARPNAKVVLHFYSPSVHTIGAVEGGLEMVDQNSIRFHGKIAYHDYDGIIADSVKAEAVASKLATSDILILRNQGTIIVANNVATAYSRAYFLEKAALAQINAYSYSRSKGVPVITIPQEIVEQTALKLQEESEELFAYYNFEGHRRGLDIDELDEYF